MKDTRHKKTRHFFTLRASCALVISVVADGLDYIGAPLFGIPIIGDVFDVIVTGLLFSITKSKVSVIINLAEFIPFADFLPIYTVSSLIWILRESGYVNIAFIKQILHFLANKR